MSTDLLARLAKVNLDSAWAVCQQLGYPDQFIGGLNCLLPGQIMVGRATTLRYVPMRKDIAEAALEHGQQLHTAAADAMQPGEVLCVDACGCPGAGFLGDVILSRIKTAGGAGVVVDGAIRDLHVIRTMGLPVYMKGAHAAAAQRRIVPIERNCLIHCAGVAIKPGDVIFGDTEGVLVIPEHLLFEVVSHAERTDHKENYLRSLIERGRKLDGVYPPSEETLRGYEEWRARRG